MLLSVGCCKTILSSGLCCKTILSSGLCCKTILSSGLWCKTICHLVCVLQIVYKGSCVNVWTLLPETSKENNE